MRYFIIQQYYLILKSNIILVQPFSGNNIHAMKTKFILLLFVFSFAYCTTSKVACPGAKYQGPKYKTTKFKWYWVMDSINWLYRIFSSFAIKTIEALQLLQEMFQKK